MSSSGLVRLRIREWAAENGWTLTEVATRSGVHYSTLKSYARSPGMAMADIGALLKLARTFDVSIEELLDFVEQ
ncbi:MULTISPECIES: helix-turn-helix transcriptional regulator [unclassified Microcoleus]|uniref:helix-turn-helix transcriptional regulator n=1 Tax=unclassified Microcoleus TaxID=2642155 RepID=UPI002FD21E32